VRVLLSVFDALMCVLLIGCFDCALSFGCDFSSAGKTVEIAGIAVGVVVVAVRKMMRMVVCWWEW